VEHPSNKLNDSAAQQHLNISLKPLGTDRRLVQVNEPGQLKLVLCVLTVAALRTTGLTSVTRCSLEDWYGKCIACGRWSGCVNVECVFLSSSQ